MSERAEPSRSRRFMQCDVFTSKPTFGNALAVVVDGDGLTDDAMASFAAWTNLAETTFLQAPTDSSADYKVRIFTPQREMPFAGHPTLGSCAAWLHAGGVPETTGIVRQECGVGIVEIDCRGQMPAFVAPPTTIAPLPAHQLTRLAETLELKPESIMDTALLDNGPVWQVFQLATATDVMAVDSSKVNWQEHKPIGLIGPHASGSECHYEVRMLAPSSGMSEDPITGSLNAAIAHWLCKRRILTENIIVAQGTCINRLGRVHIQLDPSRPSQVLVGGQSHILIEGHVVL